MPISSVLNEKKEGEEKKPTVITNRHGEMVTKNFSSPGKEDFIVEKNHLTNSNARSTLPPNTTYLPSRCQLEKIQNYSSFRCANYQRVNNFLQTASVFIKKPTHHQLFHPGKYYIQKRTIMNNQTNIQEYRRYRDAHCQGPARVIHSDYQKQTFEYRVLILASSGILLLLNECE